MTTSENPLHRLRARLRHIPDGLLVLMARVSMGAFFIRAGQTKLEGFELSSSAIYLFSEEYKVPLLVPETAAWLAVLAENGLGALLVIGLATRLSAAGLLGMTVVIQLFVYPGSWPDHLLWATALGLVLGRGPGWLATDNLICRAMGCGGAKNPS